MIEIIAGSSEGPFTDRYTNGIKYFLRRVICIHGKGASMKFDNFKSTAIIDGVIYKMDDPVRIDVNAWCNDQENEDYTII